MRISDWSSDVCSSDLFFARGEGAKVWDVDGNEYVDFMCSWGPMILGHGNPAVEHDVDAQRAAGDCLDRPSAALVAPAALTVRPIPHAYRPQERRVGKEGVSTRRTLRAP